MPGPGWPHNPGYRASYPPGSESLLGRILVEHLHLDEGSGYVPLHLPAESIDLPNQISLGLPPDRQIAGQESYIGGIHGQQKRVATHASGSQGPLTAGMSRTYNDQIVSASGSRLDPPTSRTLEGVFR